MSTFADPLSSRPDSAVARQVGIDDRTPTLKRDADGFIDYDFYIRRSRQLRAEAAHSYFRALGAALRRLVSRRPNSPGKSPGRHGHGAAHPA